MRQERLVNNASTTLNGGINASTTSVAVVSGTPFPTEGDFRIIVDSELMLVTARSGNTLTVQRGAEGSTAATHSNGAAVTAIITRGVIRQFIQDFADPFANVRPPFRLQDASENVLTSSSFSEINTTNVTITNQSNGAIKLEHAAQGGTNDFGLLVKSAPSPPWEIIVGLEPNIISDSTAAFPSAGTVIRDSTSGEFYYLFVQSQTNSTPWRCNVQKFDSPTSSSTAFGAADKWSKSPGTWLKMADDNTDVVFEISANGVDFVEIAREARTTYLTPDQVGIAINNFSNDLVCQCNYVSWSEG